MTIAKRAKERAAFKNAVLNDVIDQLKAKMYDERGTLNMSEAYNNYLLRSAIRSIEAMKV